MTLQRRATSNQRWNNVVYVNVEICNVEQRQINTVYEYVNMTIWKEMKIKPRVKNKIIFLNFKEYVGLEIFFILFFILRGICKSLFYRAVKFLKHWI